MSTYNWNDGIRGINNGEAVDAANTNRPLGDLNEKANYLKAQLDALHNGEALYLRNRRVTPECYDGCVVYYDPIEMCFAPAQAVVGFDAGVGKIADSSFVVGIVAKKLSATVADLIIGGAWPYHDTTAVLNKDVSGPRYLSATEGGLLVDEPPAFAVRVGQWLAETQELLVQPVPRDVLEGHVHYKFQLFAEPAGTPSTDIYMQKHTIAAANSSLPGWLPADDPSFAGLAPAGAKFGYNIGLHTELFKVFPPVPLDSAYIEAFIDGAGAGRELDDVVVVDQSGIWWMKDDWGWAPWASDMATLDDDSSHVTNPSEAPPPIELHHGHGYVGTNPAQQYRFSLYLWFSRPTYRTENSMVASLQPEKGSPITVKDCTGKDATTGHLYVGYDFNILDDGEDYPGEIVVKEFTATQMKRGTVVAGIKSGSDVISIKRSDGKPPNADGYYGGYVTIEYKDPATQKREFDTALFALDGALQGDQFGTFYIGLKNGVANGMRGRVDIPSTGMPSGKFNVKLNMRLYAEMGGSLPSLKFSYKRVASASIPTMLPNASTEVVLPDLVLGSVGTVSYANMYFDFVSPALETEAGDTLFFTVQRLVDSYAGIVGVLRVRAIID